jgi:hypothetical protein
MKILRMAGGKLAEHVLCMVCLDSGALTKATRVHEGVESDQYRCERGHEFGMDWSRGPATEPLWPPPPELGRP